MAKARLNRDDKGTTAFIKDFMRVVLGLSPETSGLIVQRIKKHGEWAPMKSNLRTLSGVIYKRFNTAIDMAEEQLENTDDGGEEEGEVEQPVDFDKKQNDRESDDVERKDDEAPVDFDKKENEDDVREGYTFMKYLLTELQLDVDLDDPAAAKAAFKKATRQGSKRTVIAQDKEIKQEIRDIDSTSPTAALDKRIAVMKQQLSQMEKKRAKVAGNE